MPDYSLEVQTTDGWGLSLFRIPPAPDAVDEGAGTPVLLVPGTAMNRHAFTTPGSDLAAYLAARGFDVWILEVRGSRSSTPPDMATWRRGSWGVDDFAQRDASAALAAIRATTGRSEVFWIGHSLGAVIGAILLQHEPGALAGIVGLGMPGDFAEPNALHRRGSKAGGLIPARGAVATRQIARAVSGSLHLAPDSVLMHNMFNEENVPTEVAASIAREGIEDVGGGTARQLLSWAVSGRIISSDGGQDYSAGMAEIQTPVLLVAGRIDHLTPPWSVRAAYDRWGSSDKEFLVLGRGWGQSFDYGHGDLILGDGLRDELFPTLAGWISARISGVPEADEAEPPAAVPPEASEATSAP